MTYKANFRISLVCLATVLLLIGIPYLKSTDGWQKAVNQIEKSREVN